jgi:hypothetical protein
MWRNEVKLAEKMGDPRLMEIIVYFRDVFVKGTVNSIFVHIRNLVYCGLVLAIGSYVQTNPAEWLLGTVFVEYSGLVFIVLGILLMLLNMADGLYRLSKLKHPVILNTLFVVLYLVMSIRFVFIMWEFRLR